MGLIDQHQYCKLHEQVAFFGFFESVNDPQVSRELFAVARKWAQEKGMKQLLGPMNPTTNDECGLLIEGFDSPPVFMMTYNPPYYVELVEAEGFRKAKDLLAFHIDLATLPMDRLHRIAEQVKGRNGQVTFRPILRRTLKGDLTKVKEIYNAAWQENWGFVPMTEAEVDFLAARLKPLLVEGLMWIAEAGPEPVGFLLALPDYNITFKPMEGRLLTPATLSCIPYLLGWKRHTATRVLTLGVKEAYRQKGLESALLIEGLRVGFKAGVKESEASWILEDNVMMCRMLESIGGRVYKKYRIYEREI
jgi:ribosomal protein S18 acetylase RimI-like enzyme